jgi:hypothetical protein
MLRPLGDERVVRVDRMVGRGEHAGVVSLVGVLDAHQRYRQALFDMLTEIGLEPYEGRSPEQAFARILVATVVGGTALPQGHYERYHVLGPDGCRIAVYTADDMSSAVNGFVIDPAETEDLDAVALVVFLQHRPSAVHLIPIARVAALAGELGGESAAEGSLTMNRALNDNLVMEPVVSAALGVVSTLLP